MQIFIYLFSFSDEAMDDAGCQLTVKDVANLLRARHAIITGEKASPKTKYFL